MDGDCPPGNQSLNIDFIPHPGVRMTSYDQNRRSIAFWIDPKSGLLWLRQRNISVGILCPTIAICNLRERRGLAVPNRTEGSNPPLSATQSCLWISVRRKHGKWAEFHSF